MNVNSVTYIYTDILYVFLMYGSLLMYSTCFELCRPPIGWGSTYCFTDVRVGVRVSFSVHVTPFTKGTPAQIFLGGMFLFPRALAFDFCYDLDLCTQGQAVRAFFIKMGFSLILSKVQVGF